MPLDFPERIVDRYAAVGIDVDNGAGVILEILRAIHLATVAKADEQAAIGRYGDASAELQPAATEAVHQEQALDVRQLLFVRGETCAVNSGACSSGAGNGGGKIQGAAGGKLRIEGDVEQPALTGCRDLRQAGDRCLDRAVADDPERARPFGHDIGAVGENFDCPGVVQSAGNRFDLDADLVRLDDLHVVGRRQRSGRQQSCR